jgi:hypothetical protein
MNEKQVTSYYVCTKCGKPCDVEYDYTATFPVAKSKCCTWSVRIKTAKD